MPIRRSSVANVQSALKSFSTTFTGTENPISEGGLLRTGLTHGLDWTDPQKSGGIAFGSQGIKSPPPFDDSIAVLPPGYRANQFAQGTLAVGAGVANGQETELFVLTTIDAHSAKGIEIDILNSGQRIFIARWNGALNDATAIAGPITTNVSISNGAFWYAKVFNGLLTVLCNSLTVTTFDLTADPLNAALLTGGGSPGFGFYRDNNAGTPGANDQFAWTDFACGELP